jgi:PST family polysaccharide transporter
MQILSRFAQADCLPLLRRLWVLLIAALQDASADQGLFARVLRGLVYTSFSSYVVYVCNLLASVLLARLLAPEVFGSVAMAGTLVAICGLVRQLGFDAALLQRRDMSRNVAATHLSLNLVTSLVLMAFGIVISPLVARFYDQKIAALFLCFLALSIVDAFSGHANILLQKHLIFHSTSLITALASCIGSGVALILAWTGAGAWALLAGDATNRLLSAILLWKVCPDRPGLRDVRWNLEEIRWFLRFGPWWASLLSSIALFAILQFDNFLVGTIAGSAALGFYSRAYNWATLPTARVTWVISSVAQPVYARLQGDRIRLSQAFNASLTAITRLSFLFAVVMLVLAEDAVRLVIGERWLPLVPILQWFSLYAVLRPLSDDLGAVFAMSGRMRIANLAGICQAAGLALALPPAIITFGASGAAAVVGLSYACMLGYLYGKRLPEFIDTRYRSVFLPPLAAGLIAGAAGFGISLRLPAGEIVTALIKFFVILTVYLGVLAVLEGRELSRQCKLVFRTFRIGSSSSDQSLIRVAPGESPGLR